jgi:hypothetical protein
MMDDHQKGGDKSQPVEVGEVDTVGVEGWHRIGEILL